MDRRSFVGCIAGGIFVAPLNARAQQTAISTSGFVPRTSAPLPVPPAASEFRVVQMTDAPVAAGDVDGPTWEYANRILQAWWTRVGGDWRDSADAAHGTAHYAMTPDIGGPGDIAIPVKVLVTRMLTNNTGFYIQQTKGVIKLTSRKHLRLPGPRLHIVTDKGTFDPPCIVDTWLHPSSNKPMGDQEILDFPAIIKFDLSEVTGTVTAATLTLRVLPTYVVPAALAVNYLDPPALNLTPTGGKQGIAATVAKDNALAAHPSVLLYDDLVSKKYITDSFQGIATAPPNLGANVDIIAWPQFGLSAARVWSITTNQRLISWHHWAEPKQSPPKPWQRDYGNGHTHLYFRFLLEIGTDVKAGMNERGIKLPGMAGTYDWSTSGAVTLPAPNNDGTWEMRFWHTEPSPSHSDIYHLATYFYGAEHPFSQYQGLGETRLTKGYLMAGRVYCLEQEVKLNTITNGVANADGVERVWVDGVLMYENTAIKIRLLDKVRIQSIPFVNIYHGGMGMPKAPFHYDIGGICVATEYIGPPKVVRARTITPLVGTTALGQLAVSMRAGSWVEFFSNDLNPVMGVGQPAGAGSGVAFPFSNSMPWDPINRKIQVVSADHGVGGSQIPHIEYDDATNTWKLVERGIGSHGFQHVAVNPFTGDLYLRFGDFLHKYVNGAFVQVTTVPFGLSQMVAVACCWWKGAFQGGGAHGSLMIYSGNGGSISAWSPLTNTHFAQLTGMSSAVGVYHVVSAYSEKKNCMVYGGGNTSQGVFSKEVHRLNADQTKTRMPDAPLKLGIFHGMNLVSDYTSGNFLAFGFGQLWELNPDGAGKWTQLTGTRAPPAALLDPTVGGNSMISVDCPTYGVVIYVDGRYNRSPKCKMWVYKHAQA